MNRNIAFILSILFVLLILLFSGCTETDNSQKEDGLNIVDSTYAIGTAADSNKIDTQVFSYNFTLFNGEDKKTYIESIEPLFDKDFLAVIFSEDNKIFVGKTIEPHSSILIKGQVKFNSSGLSKQEITGFDPYIYGVNVTSTKTIKYPKYPD
ncbi:MAG: hypothetical protein ACPK85_11090 [Methanosarcina sp.]